MIQMPTVMFPLPRAIVSTLALAAACSLGADPLSKKTDIDF